MSGDRSDLHESTYGIGSSDRIYLDGDHVDFAEGDSQRVVNLAVEVGGEMLTIVLDEFHLREHRLAVQRAEKWIKGS